MNARTRRPAAGSLGVLVVLLSFAALSLFLAAELNIWQDEWYSLRTTSAGPLFALRTALGFEGIPPLYPLLLDFWRTANPSVLFARALSILGVAVAAVAGAAFARRYFSAVPPAIVAAAIAFNPFSIFAAVEIRLYALALALSALLLLAFFDGFVAERSSRRARVLFTLVAVAAAYTHYFLAACVLGGALALVALRAWLQLRRYCMACVAIALACVPIVLFLPNQIATVRTTGTQSALGGVLPLLESAVSFLLPHDWLDNWFSNRLNLGYDAALLALLALGCAGALRANRVVTALAVVAATVLAFSLAAPILFHLALILPRHAVPLLVPCVLLAFAAIDALAKRRTLVLRGYVATYALFTVFALLTTYRGLAKAGDFARAAAYIESRARPGEKIYAFDQEMTGPLRFYYRGSATVVPLPYPQDFTRFDATKFVLHDAATVRERIGRVGRGTRIFLYRGDVCYDRSDSFGCRYLESVVDADYRVVSGVTLASATVRELERR